MVSQYGEILIFFALLIVIVKLKFDIVRLEKRVDRIASRTVRGL